MLRRRVIPCLLMQDRGLVKTRKFTSPTYVGDPINAIRIFNEKEVDELMLLDIAASKKSVEPDFEMIAEIAGECFMPLTYGGGVTTLDQAQRIFSLGVEKICLQSSVLADVELIRRIAARFGSQSVVVSMDIKKTWTGGRAVYAAAKSKTVSGNYLDMLSAYISAGAGEVLINSVDRDGMMQGLDCQMIQEVSGRISVPLVAAGGVGSIADIVDGLKAGASAIGVGSFFVFHGEQRGVLITYPSAVEMDKINAGI